jgi:arylsulfatase A-like enzyme
MFVSLLALAAIGITGPALAQSGDARPAGVLSQAERAQGNRNRYNVLFIAIDDLRPELGAYGKDYVNTPSIDRLAASGVLFQRHFTQVPTCGASRYAMLTGRSPASSGVRRGNSIFHRGGAALERDELDGAQSMPELFRRSGYHTVNIGKISHMPDGKVYAYNGSGPGKVEVPHAWDELATPYGPWEYGWGAFFAYPDGKHREDGQGHREVMNFEAQADDELPDGLIAERAVSKIDKMKQRDAPFFMAVGFYKPHLPFVAPEKDWRAVQQWEVPKTPHPAKVDSTYRPSSGEFYGYHMPFAKNRPLPPEARMQTRRAYLACVRYVDRQVGKVLDALEHEGLADSTVVVLWGDHGWYLGEYAIWGKHTVLPRGTRSPLIVRVPGLDSSGRAVARAVESLDIYPTLIDLCRPRFTKVQHPLDGQSLEPLLRGEVEQAQADDGAASFFGGSVAVQAGDKRLVAQGGPGAWKNVELYDLSRALEPEPVHLDARNLEKGELDAVQRSQLQQLRDLLNRKVRRDP